MENKSSDPIIEITGLVKNFRLPGGREVEIIRGLDLKIGVADFAIVFGPSGCGKSTLLHTLVGLEQPTGGTVKIRGIDIFKLSSDERARFRAEKFGIVYQASYWIRALSVWENVALPLLIDGKKQARAHRKAMQALDEVGMADYADKRPMQLSGGEQQRVGLARALVNNPWIIVADEPTGNLDTHSSDEVMTLLHELNTKHKRTIIMVTHNLIYLPLATKKIAMRDGLIVSSENVGVGQALLAELKEVQ